VYKRQEFIGLDSLSVKDKIMIEEHRMKYMTLNEIRASHDLQEIDNGNVVANYYGDALKINMTIGLSPEDLTQKSVETILPTCCNNAECQCDPEECDCDEIVIEKSKTYIAPQYIADNAQRALDVKEKYNVDYGTPVGWKRARQLANRENISIETVKRMYSFLSRHKGNEKIPEGKEYKDDAGAVMIDAWGGLVALEWTKQIIDQYEKERENEK
jgi:hypothetical protein